MRANWYGFMTVHAVTSLTEGKLKRHAHAFSLMFLGRAVELSFHGNTWRAWFHETLDKCVKTHDLEGRLHVG